MALYSTRGISKEKALYVKFNPTLFYVPISRNSVCCEGSLAKKTSECRAESFAG